MRILRFCCIVVSHCNCFHENWDRRKFITWKQAWALSARPCN